MAQFLFKISKSSVVSRSEILPSIIIICYVYRGKEFFGYSKKDIFGRSSYVLVHRQDAQHVRCKHTESKCWALKNVQLMSCDPVFFMFLSFACVTNKFRQRKETFNGNAS